MADFRNRVVVITGAGQGLGRAYARAFAKSGAAVVVNDVGGTRDGVGNDSRVADLVVQEITAAGGRAIANYDSVASITGAEALMKAAVDAFGRIDVLVNNAGILRDKTLLKMDESMFDAVIAVHLKGTYACTKAAANYMKDQNYGRIINTSSFAGLKGNFGQTNYAAAKAGIYGMTMTWAQELQRYGITSNCIAPMAKTRLTEEIDIISSDMQPEHVVPVVVMLASEAAGSVTGKTIGVHGGQVFAYSMEMSPGLVKSEGYWTPEELFEKLPSIEALQTASAEPSVKLELDALFAGLPRGFKAHKATGWNACIAFSISSVGSYYLLVDQGKAWVEASTVAPVTCTVKVGAEDLLAMAKGTLDPQQAFMQGKLKADNMGDLMQFAQCFTLKVPSSQQTGATTERTSEIPKKEGFQTGYIGATYESKTPFLVTAEAGKAYALATNSSNRWYLDDNVSGGIVAPPLFPVRVMKDVLLELLMDERLAINFLMVVHAEQDMRFYRHLKPGDLVDVKASVSGYEAKESGEIVRLTCRLFVGNELTTDMGISFFIRNGRSSTKAGELHQNSAPRGMSFTSSFSVAADQSLRYAEASGDNNPIHVDPEVAQQAGLPGIILQGLCTMACSGEAIISQALEENPNRLKRLAVRFSKFVLPGDILTVNAWNGVRSERDLSISFMTTNQRGEKVLTHGVADVLL